MELPTMIATGSLQLHQTSEILFEATNSRKNSDFPIVERKSKLPIVAIKATSETPIEANKEKLHIGSNQLKSCIVFGNIYQGCFVADLCESRDSPFVSLHVLENVFTDSNNAIFILEGVIYCFQSRFRLLYT